MRKHILICVGLSFLCAIVPDPAARASEPFRVTIAQSSCALSDSSSNSFEVEFDIRGILPNESLGLAGFSFDLSVTKEGQSCDTVPSGTVASGNARFGDVQGLVASHGFDGSVAEPSPNLVQIGGAQNTFGHATTAPKNTPNLYVCATPSGSTLATFSVVLPHMDGCAYVVTVSNVRANSIDPDQEGVPYKTSPVCLDVEHSTLSVSVDGCGPCCRGGTCSDGAQSAGCMTETGMFVCDVASLLPGTFLGCYGDADGDGVVTAGDRGCISANLGTKIYSNICKYDMDGNGVVNDGDRAYISANLDLCTALPDFQNGSGNNHGSPDTRFPQRMFEGNGNVCAHITCPVVDGSSCSSNGDCYSGHCVDGVCCDTGCTALCQSYCQISLMAA